MRKRGRLGADTRGATSVEYLTLIGIVALASVAAIGALGGSASAIGGAFGMAGVGEVVAGEAPGGERGRWSALAAEGAGTASALTATGAAFVGVEGTRAIAAAASGASPAISTDVAVGADAVVDPDPSGPVEGDSGHAEGSEEGAEGVALSESSSSSSGGAGSTAPSVRRRPRSHARPGERAVVISNYPAKLLPTILSALARHRIRRHTYVGSYGINADQARMIHARMSNLRYAPIFKVNREEDMERRGGRLWGARRLAPEQEALLPRDGRGGVIPRPGTIRGRAEQIAWGRELGRRMRDRIRAAGGTDVVDAWQLDEIWPSLAHAGEGNVARTREAVRYFMAGLLDGLHRGRTRLGDRPMRGLVHIAHPGRFAQLRTPGARALTAALDRSTVRVIGEEYPAFRGDPREAARRFGSAERHWAASPDRHARSLARKYVAGMTPGRRTDAPALGGVRPGTRARQWQREFIAAHAGSEGIGMFNWANGNADARVVDQVIAEVALGVRTRPRAGRR